MWLQKCIVLLSLHTYFFLITVYCLGYDAGAQSKDIHATMTDKCCQARSRTRGFQWWVQCRNKFHFWITKLPTAAIISFYHLIIKTPAYHFEISDSCFNAHYNYDSAGFKLCSWFTCIYYSSAVSFFEDIIKKRTTWHAEHTTHVCGTLRHVLHGELLATTWPQFWVKQPWSYQR